MTKTEKRIIRELIDALDMIAYGASTDESHYQRLRLAREAARQLTTSRFSSKTPDSEIDAMHTKEKYR
jgi:hypothetical protein